MQSYASEMLEEAVKTYQMYNHCRSGGTLNDRNGNDVCVLGRQTSWIWFKVKEMVLKQLSVINALQALAGEEFFTYMDRLMAYCSNCNCRSSTVRVIEVFDAPK